MAAQGTILQPPVRRWYCPNCGATDVTREHRPHTRMHVCPRLGSITAPMVPAGTPAKVEAKLREDYQGSQLTQDDEDGRPIMSVVVTRDEGQDCAVLAPCAQLNVREL